MKYDSDKDYIYYPKSKVPINKLGIKNAKEEDLHIIHNFEIQINLTEILNAND